MDSDTSPLQFPCRFPIKAIGADTPEFKRLVIALVDAHIEPEQRESVHVNPSRGGRYLSVTVTIEARGREQLDNIYRALSADERVIMAL
jgi:putative lipoic acid-binding regulatory protein